MSGNLSRIAATPFFLPGTVGDLFVIHHPAVGKEGTRPDAGVIVVPPFAEEMNKSRRMMSLQARELAAAGFDVLTVDLFGTGDSAGDFEQARWEIWIEDVSTAVRWLRERGIQRITLLGLRLGALLTTAAATCAGERFDRLVFWQPITSGEAAMAQVLRTRVVADMTSAEKQTTAQLRDLLRRGQSVDVAGYSLPSSLFAAIDALSLERLGRRGLPRVDWLEVVSDPQGAIVPGSQRVIDAWRKLGMDVQARALPGPPFWATTEIATAPALIAATTERFLRGAQAGAV